MVDKGSLFKLQGTSEAKCHHSQVPSQMTSTAFCFPIRHLTPIDSIRGTHTR